MTSGSCALILLEMISKKKEKALYEVIHEDIMQARIKIWKMKDQKNISIAEIDDILSDLLVTCPQKAINTFKDGE